MAVLPISPPSQTKMSPSLSDNFSNSSSEKNIESTLLISIRPQKTFDVLIKGLLFFPSIFSLDDNCFPCLILKISPILAIFQLEGVKPISVYIKFLSCSLDIAIYVYFRPICVKISLSLVSALRRSSSASRSWTTASSTGSTSSSPSWLT